MMIYHCSRILRVCVQLPAAVDDNILRPDPLLQHALFRMFSSASEQPRRLNLKVPDALSMVVQHTVSVLFQNFLISLFNNLKKVRVLSQDEILGSFQRESGLV